MALQLPVLDNRTYDELVAEGRRLIPRHAPGWTDHNASDPGITLLELFAWLTETSIYRLDRLSEASYRSFLHLLGFRSAVESRRSNTLAISRNFRRRRCRVAGQCNCREYLCIDRFSDDAPAIRLAGTARECSGCFEKPSPGCNRGKSCFRNVV